MKEKKKEKKKYHYGDLKEDLINLGAKVLIEEGIENFSLRKIAKKLGVSHGAPYKHFENKEELIETIIFRGLEEFNDSLEKAYNSCKGNNEEKLVALGVAYVKFAVDNPDFMRILFLKKITTITSTRNIDFSKEKSFTILAKVIEEIYIDYNDEELYLAYTSAWSIVHGIAMLSIDGFVDLGDNLEEKVEILLKGDTRQKKC